MPGENRHEEPNDSRVGGSDVLENNHQTNQHWLRVLKTEGKIERLGF